MTVQELKNNIYSVDIPKNWREGQFVFNRVEELYGSIARELQFIHHIDCFYNDDIIDSFIEKACELINNK